MVEVLSNESQKQIIQSNAIVADGLSKTYRTGFWLNQKISSLQDFSLTIRQGETFGVLGPNGAGKTTLLKILLGIVKPTSGTGEILGYPLGDRAAKQSIGYLPENAYYYDYLTGWELLDFIGSLFGVAPSLRRQRIADLLDLVGLSQSVARKKQLRQYSKGMVQRIGVAQALINDPEIVFLDEPMSGLDPVGRYQVREIILMLKNQGKTVFFNSHILSDVELICDRIGILNKGELVAMGTLNELLGTEQSYQVSGRGGSEEELRPWLEHLIFQNDTWHGQLAKDLPEFLTYIASIGAKAIAIELARQTLEEFFIDQIKASRHKD
ncbi:MULTISPECIES: ABC transporter ATP-binding protein [Pseudanabaena]|jgi:ABC-2 type transport system ATP-binding protein|uniref:ABC transporter ATP-binding protein n=1 Tax=Pseudanabaena TaxID=1152 RepID=UPI00247A5679|nr:MULTISPECIES: ABC transporter ATP-binding protein [Pseudanabaena]MEA5489692.1 ABC transporter ATP-binding protein [Pseudanabaena sp. CCNP1317]WGS73851.1 ABC transporter ATP-binding protein [Pseudanabaena galeata CCNP1313]